MASNPVFPTTPLTGTQPTYGQAVQVLPPGPSLPAMSLAQLQASEDRAAAAQSQQQQPLVTGLAGHVLSMWAAAKQAKEQGVEQRLMECDRARRGEYNPNEKAEIAATGGSDIYIMLTSAKCRAGSSWIRDVAAGSGHEKPWQVKPTPVPELSPDDTDRIEALAAQYIEEAMMQAAATGQQLSELQILQLTENAKVDIARANEEKAKERALKMEKKMEDQLVEGGLYGALEEFVDDIVTYPSAILKGPVLRRRLTLKWQQGADGAWAPVQGEEIRLEWVRVDPFRAYPGPQATGIHDSYFIERHTMSRADLEALIGVPGYNDDAIRLALQQYATGLRSPDMMAKPEEVVQAENGTAAYRYMNVEGFIDALQYWGSVPGRMLLEWGMTPAQVPEPTKEYAVEAWLVGSYVIKAVLNLDPLGRKPYYVCSYEKVPGKFWGNSVYDLIKPCQKMVNAAARSLSNNMAFASGPQVAINISRLAEGETIDKFFPWKIWQVQDDQLAGGGAQVPVSFFMPESNAEELMLVYRQWNELADEYSGIPRYLAGENPGTPGRTAQGMSILMSNAARGIRQVIGNISRYVWVPLLERLYDHNMKYADDPELKGDVKIEAAGLAAVLSRETEHQRRLEFLGLTGNPVDIEITGLPGRAEVLRSIAQGLNLDTTKVVPSREEVMQYVNAKQMAMQAQSGEGVEGAEQQEQSGQKGNQPKPKKAGEPGSNP